MRGSIAIIWLFIAMATVRSAPGQDQQFVPIEGASLKSRLEAAVVLAPFFGAPQAPFWAAYSFEVRPGIAVDAEVINADGTLTVFRGASFSLHPPLETRNLAVFLFYEPSSKYPVLLEIYNLERRRDYAGHPVYWLGRARNEESLNLLEELIRADQAGGTAERAAMAIALHDDPRVDHILEKLARSSSHGR